jgi:RNA recognition motif-containing protein
MLSAIILGAHMGKKVFIGGLSYQTSEQSLLEHLQKVGHVTSIRIITERETGKSKGFGFATFGDDASAQAAIETLNGQEFEGRHIGVKPYIEKQR